jgi:hypothetical protein
MITVFITVENILDLKLYHELCYITIIMIMVLLIIKAKFIIFIPLSNT